jgi:MFS family permease
MNDQARKDVPLFLPWIMWGLGGLFYCYGFFQRVAPSVMVGELMRDFAVGGAITGMLSALYFYTYASLQIPVGIMMDRWGPRRMLTVAAALCAAGSFAFATSESITAAYFGRALVGLGASVSWVGALKLASVWFPPKRFALLTGLTMAAGMAGAVGGQAPLAAMVTDIGWRGTLTVAAGLGLCLAISIWFIVRDHGPMSPSAPKPQEAGHGLLAGLKAALSEPQTYLTGFYSFTLVGPILAFAGLWGVPYMMSLHGLDRPNAAIATSVMMIGWGIGSPIFGWFSDHVGRRKTPMYLATGGSLAAMAFWLYVPGLPLWSLYPLFFLSGLLAGGIVMTFATAREHNPPWASGATLGFVNMCTMAGGAVFQPLVGWLLDLNWDGTMLNGMRIYNAQAYAAAFIVFPISHAASLITVFFIRETWCKQVK